MPLSSWQSWPDPWNLIHTSRNLSVIFDPSHYAKEHCTTRQNWKNARDSNESSFKTPKPSLDKPAFLNSDTTQKDFQKRFISREINQIIDRREIELSCNSAPTQAQGH